MHCFIDNSGRRWRIEVNLDSIRRVRKLLGISLVDLYVGAKPEEYLAVRLQTDLCLLADALYAICQPQAEAAGIGDEDFGRSLGGGAIFAARDALFAELTCFFREFRQEGIAILLESQREAMRAATASTRPARRRLRKELRRMLGRSMMNAGGWRALWARLMGSLRWLSSCSWRMGGGATPGSKRRGLPRMWRILLWRRPDKGPSPLRTSIRTTGRGGRNPSR